MSTIVLDAITANLAELERLVPEPAEPLGYGSDLWCAEDLDPNVIELPGDSKTLLAQAAFHYITTKRGDIPDAPELGRDARALLSKGLTPAGLRAEGFQLADEIRKDDRFDEVELEIVSLRGGKELEITVALTPANPAIGVFDLVVRVDLEGAWIKAVS